jgi:dCMP deaminase
MKFDKPMIETAKIWSQMSKCKRNKVGAVLSTLDGRIISTGYNGTPSGFKSDSEYDCEDEKEILLSNCCNAKIFEDENERKIYCLNCGKEIGIIDFIEGTDNYRIIGGFKIKKELSTDESRVIHAEMNAILFCAKYGIPTNNTILYVTTSPCIQCAKAIVQAGIKKVIYLEKYRDITGLKFLINCGVFVEQYKELK